MFVCNVYTVQIIFEFSELVKEYQIEKRRKSRNEHSRFHGSKY